MANIIMQTSYDWFYFLQKNKATQKQNIADKQADRT